MEIKFNFEKKHFAIFAIVLIIAGFSFVFAQSPSGATANADACTKDARICEDGTVVERNPATNCEFNACPDGSTPTAIPTWENETHSAWHDASEIRVNINDIYYSLQTAIDAGLLGGGGSGDVINNIVGIIRDRFDTENANEADFKKICTRTERDGASEAPRLLRRIIEDRLPQDIAEKYAEYNPVVNLEKVEIVNGDLYEFSCTYGEETTPQVSRISLDGNYTLIAKGTESHVSNINLWGSRTYLGADTFGWYVKLNEDNKLKFIVETEGACRTQTSTQQACRKVCAEWEIISSFGARQCIRYKQECSSFATSANVCEPANTCPVYTVPQGFVRQQTIYAWKGIDCTIEKI
ncbi:hypothetical protein COU53_02525 [Candidatus Pacearchaeota archaeon CG10_big_fil_rev_8_21_14_0_10_30_48]|nr:MAG: hypothetical protein COU53_02525 [Candidatus Pacearchaeota archaeon CG10_big_fil_rev_8_21_14_0_10_30_48]